MVADPANYLLLTVGHQSAIRRHCRQQLARFRDVFPDSLAVPAAFSVHLDKGAAASMRKQEKTQRARGMLFGSAAALLANACDITQVEVFESGVGAVNLPLVEGALGEGFATRGAHPGFMRQLSELASLVFERSFSFALPFLNHTKAEVVGEIAPFPELARWLLQSRSCIHSSLRVARKRHCGVCPACIERRQALIVGNIAEDADDYETDIFAIDGQMRSEYFQLYAENAHAWRIGDERVRERLHRHRMLSDLDHLSPDSLEALLLRHAHEVHRVYADALAG
jgi:7-cyano-7-deazaguanine synthase in queuosine biosynthesis